MEQNPEFSTRKNEHLELVFKEFHERRAGLIRALTTDFESFYDKCAPGGERLCLYGLVGENWEVSPLDKIPPEIPNPAAGINLSRDRMLKSDWAKLVAELSDSWLLAVAFYDASLFHLDKSDRMQLFEMINNLPTLLEILTAEFEERVFNNSNPEQHKQGNSTSDELEIRGKQQNLGWLWRIIIQKVLADIIQYLHEIFPWNIFKLYCSHW